MFIDERNKGLATFRAHRAEKKEIAILTMEVTKSNPNKTAKECKDLAAEIYEARKRTAGADLLVEKRKKNKKSRRMLREVWDQLVETSKPTKRQVEVTVVNRVVPNA